MESTAETDDHRARKPWAFPRNNNANPLGRAARAKREQAEREAEAAALLADLGHRPTAAERLLVAEAAALAVEARRLRKTGRNSADTSRLLVRVLRQLGIGKPIDPPFSFP